MAPFVPITDKDCCYTCVFSRYAGDDKRECHRYPPQLNNDMSFVAKHSAFPVVDKEEWCGEYIRRK